MKKKVLNWKDITIVAIILMVMMVVGSIWDFSISKMLYNPSNIFGIALATYGEAPAMIGFFVGGLLLFLGRNKAKKGVQVVQIIVGIFLCWLGHLCCCIFLQCM